jgi:protein-S-isoprenylcysteine O-methyltransferase Ste14
MSLVPAFEIGVWNAWILIALFMCVFMSSLIIKSVGARIAQVEEEKRLGKYVALISVILWLYSIFLPLKLDTAWFYAGVIIYAIGLIISAVTTANIAATPAGEPFTKGMYRYSRNAVSLGTLLVFVGVGVASASWLYLLLSLCILVLTHFMIAVEEEVCLNKFGDAYRDYRDRTPRWIGLPKSK